MPSSIPLVPFPSLVAEPPLICLKSCPKITFTLLYDSHQRASQYGRSSLTTKEIESFRITTSKYLLKVILLSSWVFKETLRYKAL